MRKVWKFAEAAWKQERGEKADAAFELELPTIETEATPVEQTAEIAEAELLPQ